MAMMSVTVAIAVIGAIVPIPSRDDHANGHRATHATWLPPAANGEKTQQQTDINKALPAIGTVEAISA
jgi:hypothetical protein